MLSDLFIRSLGVGLLYSAVLTVVSFVVVGIIYGDDSEWTLMWATVFFPVISIPAAILGFLSSWFDWWPFG